MLLAQLKQQKSAGFRRLRFAPDMEQAYQRDRDQMVRERCRPVTASALALLLLYAALDIVMLPPELAWKTVSVRAFITCPVIALVLYLSYRPVSASTFNLFYAAAYIAGGLSVVAIIGLARLVDFPMPYEGTLLILMFGYFVMGLPFRTVSLASLLIILAYLTMELATGLALVEVMINGFFIGTANIIGMVGSWLSEYRQRAHFLDRQMLELSRSEAEQESTRKSHLITVASHDLRQPLNVISLILENLGTKGLPASQSALVTRLKTSVAHFNSLLISVLDISRIHEGMVTPECRALDVSRTLAQLVDTCIDDAADRRIRLSLKPLPEPLGIMADPQLLHRILQNLVVNALEHSGADSIEVSAEKCGNQVGFEVSDNGKGIDDATLAYVFEPFFRADHEPQPHPGLGLGLAIVRQLTELMGGTCGVASEPGRGSRFQVRFPTAEAPALRRPITLPLVTHARENLRLLVVEDHDEARHWICETLTGWGYRADGFRTAEQALAGCREAAPDLLISDVHLPAMTGQMLFDRLAEEAVILGGVLMTADTSLPQGHDRQRQLWIMHKPLSPMRLRAAIVQLSRRQPLIPARVDAGGSGGSDQAK
ncbi:ATP-binding protein [Marinobacter sp.]|uniref:hybrid sensor histidine kinase/response regulator n=1 Tax=Marinobacter sp. TaxID=50741 RepID=UPI00384EFAF8